MSPLPLSGQQPRTASLLSSILAAVVATSIVVGYNHSDFCFWRRKGNSNSTHDENNADSNDSSPSYFNGTTTKDRSDNNRIDLSTTTNRESTKTASMEGTKVPSLVDDDNTIGNIALNHETILLLRKQRQEERTGRIRAELKLRQVTKELQQIKNEQRIKQAQSNGDINSNADSNDNESTKAHNDGNTASSSKVSSKAIKTLLLMESIGTIVSPFTKRMGTPRQPQLVPASRGYIQFNPQLSVELLDGIAEYNYIWIVFEFHANTDGAGAGDNGIADPNSKTKTRSTTTKRTKIRPPRAPPGLKVGQLATRSPHRPNPIGLSLVNLSHWDRTTKQLHITGLDLVNGTPVYDIKPYVPWDMPGYYQETTNNQQNSNKFDLLEFIKVPSWVIQQDEIQNVVFTEHATNQLRDVMQEGKLKPWYTNKNDGYNGAYLTIKQILAQDPRSSHKGLKSNARGTTSTTKSSIDSIATTTPAVPTSSDNVLCNTNNNAYNIIFGNIQVSFIVTSGKNEEENDGDDGGVIVTEINSIEFDPENYVDGIPIVFKNNNTL